MVGVSALIGIVFIGGNRRQLLKNGFSFGVKKAQRVSIQCADLPFMKAAADGLLPDRDGVGGKIHAVFPLCSQQRAAAGGAVERIGRIEAEDRQRPGASEPAAGVTDRLHDVPGVIKLQQVRDHLGIGIGGKHAAL